MNVPVRSIALPGLVIVAHSPLLLVLPSRTLSKFTSSNADMFLKRQYLRKRSVSPKESNIGGSQMLITHSLKDGTDIAKPPPSHNDPCRRIVWRQNASTSISTYE
ncbi:hypothetical protein ABVK25_000950 [Lepraria finkii]|uniref:Uncharacterized protein n=1 Tax=Lepraria finkii TaxID=1340010 RepID=A0ABR4BQB2_9LECA